MKVKITTNLEYDLKLEADRYNVSFAEVLEEAVRSKLAILKTDVTSINLQLARKELIKHQSELQRNYAKVNEIKAAIEATERKHQEEEEKRLQEEKARVEKFQKCHICGEVYNDIKRLTRYGNYVFCKGCYATITDLRVYDR